MNESLFLQYVAKYFRLVVGKITEKFNGKKEESPLLHKTMLTEEYSADLSWGATEIDHSVVAADVVALDSSLPLKSRDKMSNAQGKLPKIGVKMRKGEKLISDINVMIARGTDEATIAAKIFDDTTKVIKAIDVRKEIMFEQALSSGITLIDNDTNNGTGVRVDFGYKDENKFKCLVAAWGETGYTPQDDLQQLFDKAREDGNSIAHVYITKRYFNLFRNSEQGKLLSAYAASMVITDKSLLPVPSRAKFLEVLSDEYGATFHIVDSAFKIENLDGTKTSVRPWVEANIVGTPSEVVGRLVYGTLAEETNPVASVNYQKSGSHILVAKYSKTDPLEEFTSAQAICMPVIDNAEGIYLLEANQVAAGGGSRAAVNPFAVSPETLSFPKSASNREITVTASGTVTATSDADWLTLTVGNGKVTVAATTNSGAERTAAISVSDSNGGTAIVGVTQAAGN